jgi:hypothetical protein
MRLPSRVRANDVPLVRAAGLLLAASPLVLILLSVLGPILAIEAAQRFWRTARRASGPGTAGCETPAPPIGRRLTRDWTN